MKKLFLIIIISLLLLVGISTKSNNTKKQEIIELDKALAIYIENDNGEYELYNGTSWPNADYYLNEGKTLCENNGKVTWDDASNSVLFENNKMDRCYLYFSKKPTIITSYWTDNRSKTNYLYPNVPNDTYSSASEIPDFDTKPIYIRTDATSHAVCIFYNNNEACLEYKFGYNISGNELLTKLRNYMEAALNDTASQCIIAPTGNPAYCDFGHTDYNDFRCNVYEDGRINCNKHITTFSSFGCSIDANGGASCS